MDEVSIDRSAGPSPDCVGLGAGARPIRPGQGPLRARLRHPPGSRNWRSGIATVEVRRFIARPQSPLRHPARARRQRLRGRHPLPAHRAHRPRCATTASSRSPPQPDTTTSARVSTSIQTEPSPSSTGPDASPATPPTASPSKPQPGRPRETLRRDRPAPCGQVDSRSAPDHFPTGQTATTSGHMMCYENRTNPLASDTPSPECAAPQDHPPEGALAPPGRRLRGCARL